MNYEGEKFLLKLYRELYNEESVIHSGSKSDNKFSLINKYLKRLESTEKVFNKDNTGVLSYLKNRYYDKYVIKEIPESHYELLERNALERGEGHISFSDKEKEEIKQDIIKEQEKSLDKWLNYLMKENTSYPMWARYWAFQGMLKLGKYDKQKHSFSKRSKNTTSPFIELNPETLAKTIDSAIRYVDDKEITDEKLNNLISAGNFGKIYAYNKWKEYENENKLVKSEEKEGQWKTFTSGEYKEMVKSLDGKGTGWCIAGESNAKKYLEQGDIHIYFTKNKDGKYTMPRIAIRQKYGNLEEVRGIEKDQNMEDSMLEITDKKLDEFPDKEEFKRKVKDMKALTEIYRKTKVNEKLTKEEAYFVYQINDSIVGFGWEEDPRIEEILSERNQKEDGEKYFSDVIEIKGNANFSYFEEIFFLPNLKRIEENADFKNLKSVVGLGNLQSIGGNAFFSSLKTAKGLENLQSIGGNAFFSSLKTAEGLGNLYSIGGNAFFSSLETAEGLGNLQSIGGNARFNNLESSKGLENLKSIGHEAFFPSLEDVSGFKNLVCVDSKIYAPCEKEIIMMMENNLELDSNKKVR